MKKCCKCHLDVEDHVKVCPNCQFEFESKQHEKTKWKEYLVSSLVVILSVTLFVLRFSSGLERANRREEAMAIINGTIENGNYTFEEVSSLAYEDAQIFQPIYDRFISDVSHYHPVGHETNFYVFGKDRLIAADLDTTIQYGDCEIEVLYACDHDSITEKWYSFTQQSNLDGNVDVKQVAAFSNFTKLPKDQIVKAMVDFMNNIGNRVSYREETSMGNGTLTVYYGGGGELHVTYRVIYEADE